MQMWGIHYWIQALESGDDLRPIVEGLNAWSIDNSVLEVCFILLSCSQQPEPFTQDPVKPGPFTHDPGSRKIWMFYLKNWI